MLKVSYDDTNIYTQKRRKGMSQKENLEVKGDLPIVPMFRLIKKAGARASRGAANALAEILEAEAKTIAIEAEKLASHAGRKTIKKKILS